MKIGILSDTHDRLATIDQAMDLLVREGASEIIHCGDWTTLATLAYIARLAAHANLPLYGVYGNRDDKLVLDAANQSLDRPVQTPVDLEILRLDRATKRLVVYHGHHKPTLRKLIESPEVDVLLTGHTHKPLITQLADTLIINPGSTAFSIPRRKEPRSVAIYDAANGRAELLFFSPMP